MAALIERLTARRRDAAKGSQGAQRALSELRAMIARLRDERAQVKARPVPLEQAQDAAARDVLAEAERIMRDLDLAPLTRPADGRQPGLRLAPERLAALAYVGSVEAAVQAVSARLAEEYATNGWQGIGDDDRAAQIARLDADALAAELAEEATIRALERDGLAPLRRADADPRATLADDSELR